MKTLLVWLLFCCFEISLSQFSFFNQKTDTDHDLAWYAPFYSGGGYCSEARSYVQALTKIGFTNLTIHQHGDSWNQNYISGQNKLENQLIQSHDDTFHRHHGSALINICHSEPGAWYVPKPNYQTYKCPDCSSNPNRKCYKVGRTMFETDSIPSGWITRLNQMDEIWVPTNQSLDIFHKAGVPIHKLRVVEETVDTTFYRRRNTDLMKKTKYTLKDRFPSLLQINRNNTFIFLFVGKFEERKGIDLLIRAYYEEFSRDDSVMLLFLTSAYHSDDNFDQKILDIRKKYNLMDVNKLSPSYLVLSDVHQDAMPLIYSFAHALVIPSHGEGWGRPHMEAMSCETAVIATDWSGPTAFMNNDVAYMIPITGLVESPSWKGHKWADPSLTDLKRLMRHVYDHREEAAEKGRKAREHILQHFSLDKIGRKLVDEIDRIKQLLQTSPSSASTINIGSNPHEL